MQGEQWRVSVLSEWMPFLTLLSKCPCVNTADQMAERETGRERQEQRCCWGVESRAEGTSLYSYGHTCRSVCQSVWPRVTFSLKLLRPHFYMQQANGSVAMVTTERPRIFQSIKKSGGSRAPPPPTSHIHSFKWIVYQSLGGTGDDHGNTYAYSTLVNLSLWIETVLTRKLSVVSVWVSKKTYD